jgi:MoaA/NifB/PqqE/SkfB family radical SAM enzyme
MSETFPSTAIWDLTYACQLRCTHCYSESGRRPSRRLPRKELLRIADALIAMRIRSVDLSGGEPLLIEELPEIAARFAAAGVQVSLYTNGLLVNDEKAHELGRLVTRVHVSVDGASAEVHDRIRGRRGSFEGALLALASLDRAASARKAEGGGRLSFGMEMVIIQSNFFQLEAMCTDIAPRFPNLGFVSLGAAVPTGLANAARYAEEELLSEAQLAALRDPALQTRLRALLPPAVEKLNVCDNFALMMAPDRIERRQAHTYLVQIEPDGGVRALPIYEGVVGNLLHDPPEEIWRRALERRDHPLVRELSSVQTMSAWAAASRRIDWHFAAPRERERIAARVLGQDAAMHEPKETS